ncbi:hypothetical protein GB937_008312, partial [Aspergillus fischeri]
MENSKEKYLATSTTFYPDHRIIDPLHSVLSKYLHCEIFRASKKNFIWLLNS